MLTAPSPAKAILRVGEILQADREEPLRIVLPRDGDSLLVDFDRFRYPTGITVGATEIVQRPGLIERQAPIADLAPSLFLTTDRVLHAPQTTVDLTSGDEFLMRQGWEYDEDNPAVRSLVAVLATARGLGHDHFADSLDTYADACRNIAEVDVAHVLGHAEVTDVVEGLVVDTVLGDVALRALRRLGQLEKLSSRLQQPDAQPHRRNG